MVAPTVSNSKSVFTSSFADITSVCNRVLELLQALEASTTPLDAHDVAYIPARTDNQQRGWLVEYNAESRRIEVTFTSPSDAHLFATIMDMHYDFGPVKLNVHYDGVNRVLLHVLGAPPDWP